MSKSDVCDWAAVPRAKCEGEVFHWVIADVDGARDTFVQVYLCEKHAGSISVLQALGGGTESDGLRPSVEGRILKTKVTPENAHLKITR